MLDCTRDGGIHVFVAELIPNNQQSNFAGGKYRVENAEIP
jgi:hypothetical protein